MRLFRFFINLFQFNRTNWRAVALCFLAAMVFWLFNAFNKSYSTNIRFPLKFEYDESRYAQVARLPGNININVSGNGWDLFRKHFGIKVPELVIPLERPTEVKKIVASTLPPILASQVGALQINFVVSDTLQIQIDERDIHKFKIALDQSSLQFENGLGRVSPIVILPDTISIEGPKRLLHAMPDSILIRMPTEKISSNFRKEVEVQIDHSEFLKRNPPLVEVMFEIGPVMEVEKKIKLILAYSPKEKSVLQVDSVQVRFQIPAVRADDFKTASRKITALADLTNQSQQNGKLLPIINGMPFYAEVIAIDSIGYKRF